MASKLDFQQIIQSIFDEGTNRLRTDATVSLSGSALAVEIDHVNDSIRLGDGTDLITATASGPKVGLDVNILNSLDIAISASGGDNIAISDGTDTLAVNADGSLNVNASQSGTWNINNVSGTISLPTGAATEATLSALNVKVPSGLTVSSTRLLVDGSGVTQPVSGTVAATQSGTWNINNVSGAISLPTGAATSALQSTGNTSLSSIDGKLVAFDRVTSDLAFAPASVLTLDITGMSQVMVFAYDWTPANLGFTFKVSRDGTNYQDIFGIDTQLNDGQIYNQALSTNVGPFMFAVGGCKYFKCTGAGSGTCKLYIAASLSGNIIAGSVAPLYVNVGTSALPSGASTSALQTTGNTSLSNIQTSVQLIDDGIGTTGAAIPTKGMAALGTDGTNGRILKTDSSGELQVDVLTLPALTTGSNVIGAVTQSGTWNVGTLSTITNVVHVDDNTGSLTVDNNGTFAVQATVAAGTTNIAKAEDVASANADVGVPAMAIRKATPANTSDTDGDYEMLQMSAGRLWVDASGVSLTVGSHNVTNAGTFAVQATVAAAATNIAKAEDVLSADGDVGVPAMAVRKATPANTSGTDGDYEMLQMSAGRLWTSSTIDAALPAGTNAIGKLSANSGVDIGDVDILSIAAGTNRLGSVRLVDSSDADLTTTKGVQVTRALATHDLKDTGRTHVNYYAVAAAAGTTGTETAITLTKSSGTAATSTGTSFVVTSGKRFRITSFSVATRGNATATIQTTTFNFRINTGGAVTTGSTPIVLSIRSATPATASAWDRFYVSIPDGYEIVGDGTLQFGITAAATYTTNAPTWDVTITGYEY